jgi:hypothetical protein
MQQVVAVLKRKGVDPEKHMASHPKWFLDRVPREIPPPSELYASLSELFELFKDAKDSKTGKPLFDAKAKQTFRAILGHVERGCVSDPLGFPMYRVVGKDSDGLTLFASLRGTNKTEVYHQKIMIMFGMSNASPLLADALLADHRHRYNVRAAWRAGLLPISNHYDHALILKVQQYSSELYGSPELSAFPSPRDILGRHEVDGVRALVASETLLKAFECLRQPQPSWSLSKVETFVGERMGGYAAPFTPVHTMLEMKLYKQLIGQFQIGKSASYDFERMSAEWTSHVLDQKVTETGRLQIYPKIPAQLRSYHAKYLRAVNSKVTLVDASDALEAAIKVRMRVSLVLV